MDLSNLEEPQGILPFRAFRNMHRAVSMESLRLDPRVKVEEDETFSSMQDYIDELYEGVDAVYSFEDAAGRVFDCVPIAQQPSLRGETAEIPAPPDLRPVLRGEAPTVGALPPEPPAVSQRRDRHGNRMQAPPGTIPMRRVTIDQLSRFRSVRDFLKKEPEVFPEAPTSEKAKSASAGKKGKYEDGEEESGTAGPRPIPPSVPSADVNQNHRYAYTEQTVDNIGAHCALAVYSPAVNANQVFSLAQHWYSGGSGANNQTVEVGWQVYPAKYGHAQPVLFIFWTADNYATTGAYNLDAPGFVQTNNAITIGGALSPVSVVGGAQHEIDLAAYLFDGRWWLYLGGLAPANAFGYYPVSLFSGGQMATRATEVKFGGETVCSSVSWPGMGSGNFANTGWQQAAYQRQIYYFPPAGGSAWTTLTVRQPSVACYTLSLASAANPWGIYFFYGGPGGGNC
jgi:hypothetical protein